MARYKLRPIIISSPNPKGTGGQRRNYIILRHIRQYLEDPILIMDVNDTCKDMKALAYKTLCLPSLTKYLDAETFVAKLMRKVKLLNNEYDIIVSQSEHPKYVLASYILAKTLKIPWTAILQSYVYLDPFLYGFKPQNIIRLLRVKTVVDILNKTLTHCVSKIIPLMLESKGLYLKNYDILKIPLALEQETLNLIFKLRNERYEKEYDLAYMARIDVGKGLLDYIYVVYCVKRLRGRVKAVVIGDMPEIYRRKILGIIVNLGLAKDIVFAGHLEGVEKYLTLLKSKIFLYPSRVDAFPISVLEAMALGLPVVVLKPLAEVFGDAVIGADNSRELCKLTYELLNNEHILSELSKKAMEYAKRFTPEGAARSEYEAYIKTIKWYYGRK